MAYLEIARRLMINKETVTTWVKRWNNRQEAEVHERLKDLLRPGALKQLRTTSGSVANIHKRKAALNRRAKFPLKP